MSYRAITDELDFLIQLNLLQNFAMTFEVLWFEIFTFTAISTEFLLRSFSLSLELMTLVGLT